jgi:hypothetical protein
LLIDLDDTATHQVTKLSRATSEDKGDVVAGIVAELVSRDCYIGLAGASSRSNRMPFLHTLAFIETDRIGCHDSGKEGKGEVELELHFACLIEGSVGCDYPW